MHLPPSAEDLLDIVAEVLEQQVLPVVPSSVQHNVRVAANLARIVQREVVLGPAAEAAETAAWRGLTGSDENLDDLRARVVGRVRHGDDPEFESRVWEVAVANCRRELAIVKPGHDSWEGE